jgi:hypothetical protein
VQIAAETCRANDERNKEYSVHLVGPELNIRTPWLADPSPPFYNPKDNNHWALHRVIIDRVNTVELFVIHHHLRNVIKKIEYVLL